MPAVRAAVNGFGRIGRLAFRIAFDSCPELELVHINEPSPIESSAYLLKFDSIHGTWEHEVEAVDGKIVITRKDGSKVVLTYSEATSPADVDWGSLGVEVALECSGKFLNRAKLQPFFDKGCKKVVVSAPVKDPQPVLNIVYGVNHHLYSATNDHIVTAASCTTNCLAPVVKVIHEKLGIQHGCITTIHDVTNTQTVIDAPNSKKSDLRRARSAMLNLAPTSTGSATAIALIFPELKGKLNGLAVRVPLLNASITDCVFEVARGTSVEEVNALLKEAASTYLQGILGFEERPLVSTDYVNDPRSGIVDAACTQVIDGTMVKIYAWLTCKGFLRPATEAARGLKLRRLGSTQLQLSDMPRLREVDVAEVPAPDWSEGFLLQLAEQAPQVESLKLGRQQVLTSLGAGALARLPHLARLDLSGCCQTSEATLALALGGLRNLREADLSMCAQLGDATLSLLAASCPQLSRLDLTSCERFSETGLRQLARLPLRSLILSACCQLTDSCLLAIAEGMPRLSCLGLFESGESVTDDGLAHLARLRGSLTALDLGYSCWCHTSPGLGALLQHMTALRMLNIGGCEGTTDAVVGVVAQHCRQLRELDVSESQRMTAAGVRQLGALPELQELNLGWNIRLKDEALDNLPPTLTSLDLSFCGELTDRGLAATGRLPALATLTLRKCNRITDQRLTMLPSHFNTIKQGLHKLAACTSLQQLDLSYCQISGAGLAALRPLRRLSSLVLVDCMRAASPPCMALLTELAVDTLDLSDNKRLDDGSMQALSHAPRLRSLAINCCPKVSDRGLLALTRCGTLRHLSADRCPQLSGTTLAALQHRLPLLRVARPAGARGLLAPQLEY
ncbi:type I glyceraldehyde-3-phosphate dehydrogenase [Chlorella sorokiniana]|uniref:Glyceraldehyde-3-phosphate dehydrogenase A, chloroplastic n=1 Tax=Chlorella sorokiniana TaxID=3076 RepID=A0A2P6TT87_CHLSO|nr:type I glyceraldehyde-3-phosphate dehydrogenase [Chlorella sorokiniana]|eukprot:PRW57280.1 type I glyceraldehyde-3-phosphate dehydrogenase [Chlorella sorokiniana]